MITRFPSFYCLWLLGMCAAAGPAVRGAGAPAAEAPPPPPPVVWEAALKDFSDADYAAAVDRLLEDFEHTTGKRLQPGERGRVGLKIYTDSGPGLTTSPALLRAVIAALERRGFASNKIFLVGLNQLRLRFTGFLPAFSTGGSSFAGHPVFDLESGRFYEAQWFYDSPLPARFAPGVLEQRAIPEDTPRSSAEEDRKSFLATPLFLEADFWINLPAYTDHQVLGVNGALVNATLWNASNTQRFFRSPANAPAAVAEMAAIPELRERWVLNIVSLERYQFIGGPFFNSLYTASEKKLWLSADPVLLDSLMLERINAHRTATGFKPIMAEDQRLLDFAAQLGVGTSKTSEVQWRRP
jgi:hypothetical protein